MKKKIYVILFILITVGLCSGFIISQQKEPYVNYIKRVKTYIKSEVFIYNSDEDFEKQDAFQEVLQGSSDKQIFMFGDYYRSSDVNLLAAKMFIFLHKNAGYKDMLINIDMEYQEDYEKWLKSEKTSSDFVPYFTKEAEKYLIEYYKSLPEDSKFKIHCMKNATEDEGETFISRVDYLDLGGHPEDYDKFIVPENRLKTYIRLLLEENPTEKYYIYVLQRETTKFSDIKWFRSEHERIGTYLHERNPITKGKVVSTTCAVRSGITNQYTIVINNRFNNIPYLMELTLGLDVKTAMLPLMKGFGKGAIFDQVREGGWALDAIAPTGGVALIDTIYNKLNKRWDYLFYFDMVKPWKR